MRQRGSEHDACPLGERLQACDAILNELRHIDRSEIQLKLGGLDLGDVEEIVEQRQRVEAAVMDVLDIPLVALVPDRAEPLAKHQLGEADDRVERRAYLVTHFGEKFEPPRRGACGRIWFLLFRGFLEDRLVDQTEQHDALCLVERTEPESNSQTAPRGVAERTGRKTNPRPGARGGRRIARGARRTVPLVVKGWGPAGKDGIEPAGLEQLRLGAIAEGVCECRVGVSELAASEDS